MKRVIIVHCWEGTPVYCWYPCVKKELESAGFEVHVPEMPETELPKQSTWVPTLQELIGKPDEQLYLVGHSIGVATIFRYLETLPENIQIGGAVLVAGFTDNLGYDEIANYFEAPLNFEKIKSHVPQIVLIHSDNDPYVPLKYGEELEQKLDAELIVKPGMEHFSKADDGTLCTEFPDVIQAVKRLAGK